MVKLVRKRVVRVARQNPVVERLPEPPAPMCAYVLETDIGGLDAPSLAQMEFELEAALDTVRWERKRRRDVMSQIMKSGRWVR